MQDMLHLKRGTGREQMKGLSDFCEIKSKWYYKYAPQMAVCLFKSRSTA